LNACRQTFSRGRKVGWGMNRWQPRGHGMDRAEERERAGSEPGGDAGEPEQSMSRLSKYAVRGARRGAARGGGHSDSLTAVVGKWVGR